MKMVQTGKVPISLMALIAIWAISLTVNLPGLAITPMLDTLKVKFHASELEVQLLTALPNLLIIPFVLLSGKLSMSRSKIAVVVWALVIYLGCGIAYFFARSMVYLIVVSSLLGCGCGLLIPLAAGLLSDTFVGKYREKQMGIKSGISNVALVAATFIVGWLAAPGADWRLPFLVYLIPLIPLLLTPFLKQIPKSDLDYQAPTPKQAQKVKQAAPAGAYIRDGFYVKRILSLVGIYVLICLGILAVSYYLPFIAATHHISDDVVGTATSLLYLGIFLPGFLLIPITRTLRGLTLPVCATLICAGLLIIALFPAEWSFCAGAVLTGLGYGAWQPLIYDKTTMTVIDQRKATLALSFVLAGNYIAIALAPFFIKGLAEIFHCSLMGPFPFWATLVLMGALLVVVCCLRKKAFVFQVHDPDELDKIATKVAPDVADVRKQS